MCFLLKNHLDGKFLAGSKSESSAGRQNGVRYRNLHLLPCHLLPCYGTAMAFCSPWGFGGWKQNRRRDVTHGQHCWARSTLQAIPYFDELFHLSLNIIISSGHKHSWRASGAAHCLLGITGQGHVMQSRRLGYKFLTWIRQKWDLNLSFSRSSWLLCQPIGYSGKIQELLLLFFLPGKCEMFYFHLDTV